MSDMRQFDSTIGYAVSWREAVPGCMSASRRLRELARTSVLSAMSVLSRRLPDTFIRCLYCHYVFDDQVAEFNRIIGRLRLLGTFIDTNTLLDMLAGRRPVDARYFHLSFDDGFRNNFTNALPVLRNHGVPAIFFVPSALVGADWERARDYCLDVTHYGAVIEMMRWDDLAAILDAGYEVGSHTRTHARFSAISTLRGHLENEIHGSKQDLEARLGYRCRYISWPYGRIGDADASSVDFTREAGYDACFGAFRGTVRPGRTDRYRIPRHHFEPHWPLGHVEYFARGNMETVD